MKKIIRIGTRSSELAVWQATLVLQLLKEKNINAEIVHLTSDGDIDLVTPLYEIGVQGIFTKTLDAALLSNKIDIAVHSMKDVPTQLAKGITQAAVLKRGNSKDIFVLNEQQQIESEQLLTAGSELLIATSSIRRKVQWLHRFPHHQIENLRGNVNTRLKKLKQSNWHGAVFAAAGLERINLCPQNAINLNWMLPAPAQGAIMIVCREDDNETQKKCLLLNNNTTALCTRIERDFLKTLLGGCSTPIGALAEITENGIVFKGNIFSLDGQKKVEIEKTFPVNEPNAGIIAATEVLQNGGEKIMQEIKKF